MLLGARTGAEVLTAWEAGADRVKVFPASVLGPEFIKAVHGPWPQIPLVPTGGITAENAGEFIRAGAAVVCAGSWLVDRDALSGGGIDALRDKARQLVQVVREA